MTDRPDYDDLVELPTSNFSSFGLSALPGAQSVDVVDIVWLTDDQDLDDVSRDIFQPAFSAGPLQTRDFNVTGVSGGSLGPYTAIALDGSSTMPWGSAIYRREWPDSVGIYYGMRVLHERNQQSIVATGEVLGRATWATRAENRIAGPQAGIVWLSSRGPWALQLQGTAVAGFNSGRVDQIGEIGEDLTPGRHNHPLYLQQHRFAHSESNGRFSPAAELVAQTSVRLTDHSAIRVGWTGLMLDNVLIASDRVAFNLPSMGLRDSGNQSIIVHDLYCGFEWVR